MYGNQRPFSLRCHFSPWESRPTWNVHTLANWLPTCLIHSPASISQLHGVSSIDKIQLLLAMLPWKGSRRSPLNHISRVTAAAPRVKDSQVSHCSFPAILAAAAAAEAGADHLDPPPCRTLAKAFLFILLLHRVCSYACTFSRVSKQVLSWDHA